MFFFVFFETPRLRSQKTVSKVVFGCTNTKSYKMYAFDSIFEALHDVHTSAPLQSQYLYDNVFVFLTQSFLWSSTRLEVVYESTNQRKQFIRSSVLSISTDSSIFQNDTPTPYRIKKRFVFGLA